MDMNEKRTALFKCNKSMASSAQIRVDLVKHFFNYDVVFGTTSTVSTLKVKENHFCNDHAGGKG